jgi:transposase-like protein
MSITQNNVIAKVTTTNSNTEVDQKGFNFTPEQYQVIVDQLVSSEEGLNSILQMTLNSLMKAERGAFLLESSSSLSVSSLSSSSPDSSNSQTSDESKDENGNGNANKLKNKANGYRFGRVFGQGRELSLHIPRDRLGLFKPVITAIYEAQMESLTELSFDLYGSGLTTNQIGEILGKFYGRSLSDSSISRITVEFREEMKLWRGRSLESFYPIILIDCTFLKTKRGEGVGAVKSEAYYVVLGVKEDCSREVLGIYNHPTESASLWREILQDLKQRGVEEVNLIVADGLTGLEETVHQEFPKAKLQKCVTHLKRNILLKVRPIHKSEVAQNLREVFLTQKSDDSVTQAKERLSEFIKKWGMYPHVQKLAEKSDLDYYFTYLTFDWRVRSMIYTTNWIERLNKSFKRSTKIRNSFPSPDSALCLLSKIATQANQKTYSYPIHMLQFDKTLMTNQTTQHQS